MKSAPRPNLLSILPRSRTKATGTAIRMKRRCFARPIPRGRSTLTPTSSSTEKPAGSRGSRLSRQYSTGNYLRSTQKSTAPLSLSMETPRSAPRARSSASGSRVAGGAIHSKETSSPTLGLNKTTSPTFQWHMRPSRQLTQKGCDERWEEAGVAPLAS